MLQILRAPRLGGKCIQTSQRTRAERLELRSALAVAPTSAGRKSRCGGIPGGRAPGDAAASAAGRPAYGLAGLAVADPAVDHVVQFGERHGAVLEDRGVEFLDVEFRAERLLRLFA